MSSSATLLQKNWRAALLTKISKDPNVFIWPSTTFLAASKPVKSRAIAVHFLPSLSTSNFVSLASSLSSGRWTIVILQPSLANNTATLRPIPELYVRHPMSNQMRGYSPPVIIAFLFLSLSEPRYSSRPFGPSNFVDSDLGWSSCSLRISFVGLVFTFRVAFALASRCTGL